MNQFIINRTAVKRYALGVAKASRAHLFTRVAKVFYEDVEAQLESRIRKLAPGIDRPLPSTVPGGTVEVKLFTGLTVEKFREVIQTAIKQIVSEKIRQMPSAGKTLV